MLEALMKKHILKPEYNIIMQKMSSWHGYSTGYRTVSFHTREYGSLKETELEEETNSNEICINC